MRNPIRLIGISLLGLTALFLFTACAAGISSNTDRSATETVMKVRQHDQLRH